MGYRSILFMIAVVVCMGLAPFVPMVGVIGYITHYNLGPETQWWARQLNRYELRYSFTIALLTAIGLWINWRRIRPAGPLLLRQEKLLLAFLGVVWLSWLLGEPTVGRYTTVDHPSVKFTKVVIFALMLTHIATDTRKINWVLWALVIGALLLGIEAWETPSSSYRAGRLETVGGPDFREANRLGGYLGAMLFLIGVQLIRSRWLAKPICLAAGALAVLGIIQTDSRGALVGLLGGSTAAAVLAPKRARIPIVAGIIVALIAGYSLTDPRWRTRMGTIFRGGEDRDRSSANRIEIWRGSWKMLMANPLGVGVGNFNQSIGRYAPTQVGRSAHDTYAECAGELGWPGLAVMGALIGSAFVTLRRVRQEARELPEPDRDRLMWSSYGIASALAALLTYGLFGSLLYMEGFWWMLLLPACLVRAVEYAREGAPAPAEAEAEADRPRRRRSRRRFRRTRTEPAEA